MRGHMNPPLPLHDNILMLAAGIEACIEKKLSTPALILIYSAIDTVGWLDTGDAFATKTSFMTWVDSYLLTGNTLACSALDLYAARCGLLHTFTPDSKLRRDGKARYINYAWGKACVDDLWRSIELTKTEAGYVAVHVNDLYEAWQIGVLRFCAEVETDPERRARVYKKADQFFAMFGTGTMSTLLRTMDQRRKT